MELVDDEDVGAAEEVGLSEPELADDEGVRIADEMLTELLAGNRDLRARWDGRGSENLSLEDDTDTESGAMDVLAMRLLSIELRLLLSMLMLMVLEEAFLSPF